jgi:hypothetical protein
MRSPKVRIPIPKWLLQEPSLNFLISLSFATVVIVLLSLNFTASQVEVSVPLRGRERAEVVQFPVTVLPTVPLAEVEELQLVNDSARRKRIAVAVTLTDDSSKNYVDLFAAVSQSVYEWQLTSKFDIDLIAFARKGVVSERTKRYLKTFLFQIIEKDMPLTIEDIRVTPRSAEFRKKAGKSGCCGLAELMKLYSYQMTEYHRVLHIDFDVLILQNIDNLMELPDNYELIHTNGTFEEEAVSGGVLLFKPNPETFEDIMAIIRRGDFRYDGTGWEGSRHGYTYGGETVQGVLPFYYHKKQGDLRGKFNTSLRIDRCTYNHQGSDFCNKTKPGDIKIMHMTICQKPFVCSEMDHRTLCKFHQDNWWNMTFRALDRRGIERNPRCDRWNTDGKVPKEYVPFKLKDI